MGNYYSGSLFYEESDICHFGRKGMKWGKNIFNTYAEYLRKIGKKKEYKTELKKEEAEEESSTTSYKKPAYSSSGTKVFGDATTSTTTKKKKKKSSSSSSKKKSSSKKSFSKKTTKKAVRTGVNTADLKYAGTDAASKDVMNFLKGGRK